MSEFIADFAAGGAELGESAQLPADTLERLRTSLGPAGQTSRVHKLLRRALAHTERYEYAAACELAKEALGLAPDHPQANHIMAIALDRLGALEQAMGYYERAIELAPEDHEIIYNLGVTAWRRKFLDLAEKFFRAYLQRVPTSAQGYNNLAGVLREEGRFAQAIDLLRPVINMFPSDARLWNTMGCIVVETGDFERAKIFFGEAIRLRSDFGLAYHNLGYLLLQTGPFEDALEAFDLALKLALPPAHRIEAEVGRATALCHLGRLKEGFAQWESRRNQQRPSMPRFLIPGAEWQGEALAGKRILLVAEQGLGDEIMFAHAIPDILAEVGPEGAVFIACAPRLVTLFERSFPGARVRPYANSSQDGRAVRFVPWIEDVGGVDCWSLFASLLRYRRTRLEDFAGRAPLLQPDPERVAHWRGRLAALGRGPKVGISWKSLLIKGERQKLYSAIRVWESLLRIEGVHFVNLQYGDCAADITEARERFGATIHTFDDLDIKDDIEGNAALCAALDLVITAPNAAGSIAGAAGAQVWLVPPGEDWRQLGTDRFPWFAKTRVFVPAAYGDFGEALGRAAAALKARLAEAASAAA